MLKKKRNVMTFVLSFSYVIHNFCIRKKKTPRVPKQKLSFVNVVEKNPNPHLINRPLPEKTDVFHDKQTKRKKDCSSRETNKKKLFLELNLK
ncbi:hypothetical protein DOY81_010768 [Sarcophaga bullata]|nr:hypothetical protein DOY81_010768 [Sarcophaga bullata]